MSEEKKIKGWADVQLNPAMPLDVLVNFLNVLNQRLCSIENVVTVAGPEGKMISLTDLYALQAEEAQKQAEAQAQQGQEQPEQHDDHQGA